MFNLWNLIHHDFWCIYIFMFTTGKSTVFRQPKLISVVLRWPPKITVDFLWPERTIENNVIFGGQVLASENNKEVSVVKKSCRILHYVRRFFCGLPSEIMKILVTPAPSHSLSSPMPNLSHARRRYRPISVQSPADAARASPTLSPCPSSRSKPPPPYAACPTWPSLAAATVLGVPPPPSVVRARLRCRSEATDCRPCSEAADYHPCLYWKIWPALNGPT
jgi:hypothetical protein